MKSGEIVLNMHKKGYSLDQIVEITNLDVSAVKAIIKNGSDIFLLKVYKNEKTGCGRLQMICETCGNDLQGNEYNCPFCGAAVDYTEAVGRQKPERKKAFPICMR